MKVIKGKAEEVPAVPFLADFQPMKSLWNGPQAPYPSETAARWAYRSMREDLARAQAVAMVRGRLVIHPQRFAEVAGRTAISRFVDRVIHD